MGTKALANAAQVQDAREEQEQQRKPVPRSRLRAPGIMEQVVSRVVNPDTNVEYTGTEIETLFADEELTVTYSHAFKGLDVDRDFAETFHNYSFTLKRDGTTIGVLHLHYSEDPETKRLTGSKIKVSDFGSMLVRGASKALTNHPKSLIPSGARAP